MTADRLLQIATHPLGLAGLALFLVFGSMARNRKMPSWWPKVSASLAGFALLGGFGIAIVQVSKEAAPISTQGNCAPALSGVTVGESIDIRCDTTKGAEHVMQGSSPIDRPTALGSQSAPNPSVRTSGDNSPALAGVAVRGSIKIESTGDARTKVLEDRSGEVKR